MNQDTTENIDDKLREVALDELAAQAQEFGMGYDKAMNQDTPKEFEKAPKNSLPSWEECQLRVINSNGGYGADGDSKLATELHKFIYEYDDADNERSEWFFHRLEKLIIETEQAATQAASDKHQAAIAMMREKRDCDIELFTTLLHFIPQNEVALYKDVMERTHDLITIRNKEKADD